MASVTTNPASLHDLTFEELEDLLVERGFGSTHAREIWRSVHREQDLTFSVCRSLPGALRDWLVSGRNDGFTTDVPAVVSDIRSNDDRTRKFLLKLEDGHEIETVIMGYPGRFTVCVSTQVGCAMGCVFCATGQMGFVRHLRPGEIVAQALLASRVLKEDGHVGPRNIVLMGMGEPLHNYDAVIKALKILGDHRGLSIGPSRMTICTVGVVPEIRRLARENQPYNLAVSLHAATDEDRTALVPVNARWPLDDILDACREYSTATDRKVFFGWTLIAGKNDSEHDARQVAGLLHGMNAQLNLIPLNPTDGYDGGTVEESAARTFSEIVQAAGIPCTIRQRRGIDVAAGCGQLRSEKKKNCRSTQKLRQ